MGGFLPFACHRGWHTIKNLTSHSEFSDMSESLNVSAQNSTATSNLADGDGVRMVEEMIPDHFWSVIQMDRRRVDDQVGRDIVKTLKEITR